MPTVLLKLKTQFFFGGPLYHSIFMTVLAGSTFRFSSFSIAFESFFVCSCWNQTQYYYVLLILSNHSRSRLLFCIYNTVTVLRDENGTWDFRLEGCLCCCLWNFGFELLHWDWNERSNSNSNSGTRWRYLLSHTLILVQQFLVRIP